MVVGGAAGIFCALSRPWDRVALQLLSLRCQVLRICDWVLDVASEKLLVEIIWASYKEAGLLLKKGFCLLLRDAWGKQDRSLLFGAPCPSLPGGWLPSSTVPSSCMTALSG